jgi:hypothetical protein
MRQIDGLLLHVVEQTARRCDDDVHAAARTLSSTWAASSRVGVRISARTTRLPEAEVTAGIVFRRCRIGSVKPAVVPVPVCAPASRSPPLSTAGIACVWIGVGVV